jgi:hypothetical protein
MSSSMMQRLPALECPFCRVNFVVTSCAKASRLERRGLIEPLEATDSQ